MKTALRIISAAIAVFAVAFLLRALFRGEKRAVTATVGKDKRSVTVASEELRPDDRVAFHRIPPDEGIGIARVVAFPGERVEVIAGTLKVDGSVYPHTRFQLSRAASVPEIVIPRGRLYLLCETPGPDSIKYGPVQRSRIVGKIVGD